MLAKLELDKNLLVNYFHQNQNTIQKNILKSPLITKDWLWSLYLPLLLSIKLKLRRSEKPLVIGISGLPGSGKSSFGSNFEQFALSHGIDVKSISLDDFYMQSTQLETAMRGNPWGVPRGLPGSHSIEEIRESLDNFVDNGFLKAPQFDKSLRGGLGDRTGWIRMHPKVLILEGWFLGCYPIDSSDLNKEEYRALFLPPLSDLECKYRINVQNSLEGYSSLWSFLDKIVHIKAYDFFYTSIWKKQQEDQLFKLKGNSLRGERLNSFIRMIQASIPLQSLQSLKSDFTIVLNQFRQVIHTDNN
ncbi:uridine kinase [Prochlorococcus sp. MIT 1223]|uniref:uridine kinase n=1 Tax=Prochlorococcus sp. MIT 1223 TaxID=3096217 RepID=UPI002A7501F7|nr:uridine kinase [Prochlorococcus sp. MIT 1223]